MSGIQPQAPLPSRPPSGAGPGARRGAGGDAFEGFATAAAAAALLGFVAFNEGGLDLVFRQQFGVALLWALALAFAFGALPRVRPSPDARRLLAAFGALAAWTALAALWGESAERAVADLGRVLLYGGAAAAVLLAVSRQTWTAFAGGVCALLLAVPALAVVSFAIPGSLDSGPLAEYERLSYPLGYWNALAAWSAMAATAGLALSAQARGSGIRALCLAAVPFAGLSLYLTLSRGGALAAAAGLIAVLALSPRRSVAGLHLAAAVAVTGALVAFARANPEIAAEGGGAAGEGLLGLAVLGAIACGALAAWTRPRRRRWSVPRAVGAALAALAVAAVVAAGFAWGDDAASGELSGDPAARLTTLEGSRPDVWASALRAAGSDPITGVGAGSFEFWWTRDVSAGEALREPHSLYLGHLAELGVPGLLLVLAVVGVAGFGCLRAVRAQSRDEEAGLALALTCASGAFALQAAIDWLWESTALSLVAIAGVAAVLASGSEPRGRAVRRRPLRGRALATLAAIGCGVLLVPGTVATERVRASFSALILGRPHAAERIAGDAIVAEPWAATPYAARALARAEAGDLDGARDDALEAIEREETNWRHRLLLATLAAREGDEAAARDAYRRARELNPGIRVPRAAALQGADDEGP